MTQDRRITDKLPGQPLQWDETASPSAAPAAGQAGLAKLEVHTSTSISDIEWMMEERFYRAADVEALITSLAAPVAAQSDIPADAPAAFAKRYSALVAENVRLEKRITELEAAPVAADTEQAIYQVRRKSMHNTEFHWRDVTAERYYAQYDADEFNEKRIVYAAPLATPADAGAGLTDEQLRDTNGYKLGWMEGMQEGAELATGGEKTAADVEAEFAGLLPGSYYMDPPDGGSPSVLEQVSRMAEDAAQWRAHLTRMSTPGAQVTAPKINTPEFHDLLGRYMRRPSNDTAGDIVAHVQKRFDAYAKGVFAATEYLRDELIKARAAVGSPAPVTAEPAQSIDTPEFRALLDAYACASPVFKTGTVSPIDAARAAILAYLATPAPADRDAIRDQALEDAAGVVLKLTAVPRDVLGPATAQMKALAANGEKLADRIRALKSMERAADAKGDQQ